MPPIERKTPSEFFVGKSIAPEYSEYKIHRIEEIQHRLRESFSDILKLEKMVHDILGSHDVSTESHSFNTSSVCYEMFLQIDREFTNSIRGNFEDIYIGAMLHDFGKIFTDVDILNKVESLTHQEVNEIKKHPVNSHKILKDVFEDRGEILNIVLYHHEKWDGSGYPYGLKEEEIPKSARIFAIIDVWDALTADRPYRKYMPHDEALILMDGPAFKGHFDPVLLHSFMESKKYLLRTDLDNL